MTDDEAFIAEFQKVVEAEQRDRRQVRNRRLLTGAGIYFLILLICLLVIRLGGENIVELSALTWFMFTGGFGVYSVKVRNHSQSFIDKVDDPRLVGVLAWYCLKGDRAEQRASYPALLRLLPLVRASHADCFTAYQKSALYSLIREDKPLLAVPILNALQQINDIQAIPIVKQLGEAPEAIVGYGVLFRQRAEIREAANRCLPHLETCAAQERLRRTLVRASNQPDDSCLLRPAAQNHGPAEQLLRPIDRSVD